MKRSRCKSIYMKYNYCETSRRIGFYSVYLVSLQGLPFIQLYFKRVMIEYFLQPNVKTAFFKAILRCQEYFEFVGYSTYP